VLEGWRDQRVAVRVVAGGDVLVAVFCGRLGPLSAEKAPSQFWPVYLDRPVAQYEKPGVYAHPELVSNVQVRPGGFVVEFTQAGVTVNVRLLAPRRSSKPSA
jgi:hypothetical protein